MHNSLIIRSFVHSFIHSFMGMSLDVHPLMVAADDINHDYHQGGVARA